MESLLIRSIKIANIRYKVTKVLQDKINSMRANHQDTTQLTEILNKAKSDDTFLMQLGAYCIDLANSEATTADISTSTDGINDGAYQLQVLLRLQILL